MKYDKIYIMAPRYCATGGVELSHQLADFLSHKRDNVYLVYCENIKGTDKICETNVGINPVYEKYHVQLTSVIEDSPSNILILPENFFDFIFDYHQIQIGCWWMSVDNRYGHIKLGPLLSHAKGFQKKLRIIGSYIFKGFYHYKNTDNTLLINDHRIIHFYQSHYAFEHLKSLGFTKLKPLSDYINTELFSEIGQDRSDLVLYNPLKGFGFTKKIISMMPDCTFVPLYGLSREQLRGYLSTAKIYIDFGHFPGKDRLPREAAINGCCVITGKLGASYYQEDVPILDKYKFDVNNDSLNEITKTIRYVLEHYPDVVHDFDAYRSIIKQEKEVFYKEITDAFL